MPPAHLAEIEAIRQAKARYIRGVDEGDAALVREILHPDCRLDYLGCFVDPATGTDYFPAMSIVLKAAISSAQRWSTSASSASTRSTMRRSS